MKRSPFNICNGYFFDFSEGGLFTIVSKEGRSLYEQALPLFERLVSHLIWLFFWSSLVLVMHTLLPLRWLKYADSVFMVLFFAHLFLFGCRLTSLLLIGGLKPILFPPLWIRLTRQFQKGKGIEILKRYQLEEHPGLLANLALVYHSKGQYTQARHLLQNALNTHPNHPQLLELIAFLPSKVES